MMLLFGWRAPHRSGQLDQPSCTMSLQTSRARRRFGARSLRLAVQRPEQMFINYRVTVCFGPQSRRVVDPIGCIDISVGTSTVYSCRERGILTEWTR